MGDTTSAGIFGDIFTYLAQQPDQRARDMARVFYKKAESYDFCTNEMECDEALIDLKLAHREPTPEGSRVVYKEP